MIQGAPLNRPTEGEPGSPRVSVISPFLNAEKFLAESVESVLAQDYQDFEILLVDDGSTDDSTRIAVEFATRYRGRVKYLEHEGHANRGTCASRNLAVREARGELLAFIDADDRWRPSKLSDQVALLDRMPGVDAVCGRVNYWASHEGGEDRVVTTGHVINAPVRPPEALVCMYPLGNAAPPCPSDLLMRRGIVEDIGGFEEAFVGPLQLYEDQAFLSKFYLLGTIYCDDRVWLDYRLHEDSCDARVARAGLYDDVRKHYLHWLETYLASQELSSNAEVELALKRAWYPYRRPRLSAFQRRLGRVARKVLRR